MKLSLLVGLVMLMDVGRAAAEGPAVSLAGGKYVATEGETFKRSLLITALDSKIVPFSKLVVFELLDDGAPTLLAPASVTGSATFEQSAPATITIEKQLTKAGTLTLRLLAMAGGTAATAEISIDVRARPTGNEIIVLPVTASVASTVKTTRGKSSLIDVKVANTSDIAQSLEIEKITTNLVDDDGHSVADVTATVLTPKLTVPPKSTSHALIEVGSLPQGELKGDLELVLSNKQSPIPAAITIDVKRCFLWAALAIGAGILVGFAFSMVKGSVQPRIVHGLLASESMDKLAAIQPADAATEYAKSRLRAQGTELASKVRGPGGEGMRKDVDGFAARVRLLDLANDAARQLVTLLPDTQKDKRKILDDILAAVTDPSGDGASGFSKLGTLAFATAKLDDLDKTCRALEASAKEHAESSDPALAIAVEHDVGPTLEAARNAIDNSDAVTAADQLERARRALADAGTRAILAALESRPGFVDASSWTKIRNEVNAAIGLARRNPDAYETVRDQYVDSLARVFVAIARERIAGTPDEAIKSAADDVQKTPAKPRLERVRVLRALQDKLAAGTSDRAPLSTRPRATTASHQIVDTSPIPSLPALGVAPPPFTSAPPASTAKLRLRAIKLDLGTTMIALVLALLGGLQVLWLNDANWGSNGDFLVAFLWGAGAKFVSDAFTGVSVFRSLISKVT